jgi:secreted trypsin-like serine protease
MLAQGNAVDHTPSAFPPSGGVMRNAAIRSAISSGLVLMLGACGPEVESVEQAPVGVSEAAIIRGTEDQGDPAIVAILAQIEGKEGQALCTGTLIAPTVVLTAAHCVDPAVLGGPAKFLVLSDWNLADGAVAEDQRHAVKAVEWDPEFSEQNLPGGHDIAVVVLEQPMAVTPMKWNDRPLPAALAKSQVRIVGYGLSDGFGQTGAGIKRTASTRLNSFDNLILQTGGFMSARICSGDSGGPVLAKLDGIEQVVGVNSFGFALCIANGNSTRVDTYKSFVQKHLPQ